MTRIENPPDTLSAVDFGHASVVWQEDSTLQQSYSPAWLNLAEHGWAEITSDGKKMWLQGER